MIKNYLLIYLNSVIILGLALLPQLVSPQEPKIFTRTDFDLSGPVKSCRVITDYGKEDFEFSNDGLLTKSVTRYNENDYDISYYKYDNKQLVERRDERYQDGKFDPATSMAHFYEYDSIPEKRVTERILSYDKVFQEQYDYIYNKDNKLVRKVHSHSGSVDETLVEYTTYKDEVTVSFVKNGLLQKTVRTSTKKAKDGSAIKIVLEKHFLDGIPERAEEHTLNEQGQLISKLDFVYKPKEKSFVPLSKHDYSYDSKGKLESITSTSGNFSDSQEYLYQFDGRENGNWVKKIITPENSYTTRVIEYYEELEVKENRN